jgi:hypothetical protein
VAISTSILSVHHPLKECPFDVSSVVRSFGGNGRERSENDHGGRERSETITAAARVATSNPIQETAVIRSSLSLI